jgi:hypothetical protein
MDCISHKQTRAVAHFARRTIRKGKKQYAIGRYALLNKISYTMNESTRLTCACGRKNEQWPI